MSCWDCIFVVKSGNRFVGDFECSHPQNKGDDVRNIALSASNLDEGCEYHEPITSKKEAEA